MESRGIDSFNIPICGGKVKKAIGLFSFCMVVCMLQAQASGIFSWQFALYTDGGSNILENSSSQPVNMQDGEKFRLYLLSDSHAYCYILDEQPDGTTNVLWDSEIQGKSPVLLPSEENFFVLGPPDGTEKLHVIISGEPLKHLSALLDKCKKHIGSAEISRQVLDEVGRLKISLSSFTEVPVKPAVMGAATRGLSSEQLSATAIAYSGAAVYVKTVRIKH